jgi:RNA-binding protein
MPARIASLHPQTAPCENLTLENRLLKQYRAIAHKLHPIVTVGGQGLTSGIETELDRALTDHELVKIRVNVGDREARDAVIEQLVASCGAELVQRIGHTATLLRHSANADPRKSNLQRMF